MARYLSHVFYTFAVLLFLFLAIRFFIVSPGRVDGLSMEPNYIDEQLFFVNKFVYLFNNIQRYDVVQIIEPESKKMIIKRIIGMPGEVIIIKRGKVFIAKNSSDPGEQLKESYLNPTVFTSLPAQNHPIKYLVPSGMYFVLGDNRNASLDSRYFGPVVRSDVVGRVIQ